MIPTSLVHTLSYAVDHVRYADELGETLAKVGGASGSGKPVLHLMSGVNTDR